MNTWDLFSESNEKPTPHEKFKRGVKSAGYDMDAGAKRLEDLLAKQKAERDAREKEEQKNVSEAQDEVDYDDDYQDMVRRVGQKAKAADALKAQGKEPQTKFNSKTGRYYVDHGQDNPVKENAEELGIGDPVIITGDVRYKGQTGDIDSFGDMKRFVVVHLYNHGKHSFHSSDVEYNEYADHEDDLDEAGYGRNRGYTSGFASPNAPSLGGRGHREDDEGWGQEQQALTTTWYIRANGKIIKDKMGVPYQYRGKETAAKAARTMMSKPYNAGKKFVLTTKAEDDQPENEAVLHTNYKHNRFKAVTQRDQEQDQAASRAMNNVNDEVAEAQTDYQKRRQRERDVDAGKPVKPEPRNPQNDYFARRKKERDLAEERTETKNEKGEVTSWRDESDWRKVGKEKDGRGRVTNLSDKARRETEKLKKPVKMDEDSQATAMQVYQYMIRQAPEFMKTAITADVKRAIAKAMSYGSQISVPDLASYAYGILKTNDLDEGWKSALGGAALAGAMALGGAAHAQSSGEDFLPEIVAHVTFKINGNTVTKDINLGNSFKSPGEASAALQKFLKSKGIKFYEFSIERVKPKNSDYLEKTPASDTGASGSMDSGPYSASGSSDNYMAKESIDEAVARAVKSMAEDGYEFKEEWSQKYKSSINCSHPKGFSQKAHCAGKKKHNESVEMEMVCEDCGMCQSHGSLNEIAKGAKDANGVTKCWPGKHAEGTKKGRNGGQVRNCVPNESVAEGLPQTLRKVVPGYARREIDKKMDAEKFGRTDVDRDANFARYKKIQDKLKEQGVAEGAPELLKKEMPLHRHAEKLLAQNGVSKDDPDYHHHLGNTIKHLRQFGNIDLINKSDEQGVAEGEKHGLYYNVNKRKKAGTSRPASSPKAPTAQAWKDAAKTAKNESVAEGAELKQAKRKYNQAAKDANLDQVGAGKKIDTMKNSLRQKDVDNKKEIEEDLEAQFDMIEDMVETLAETYGIDAEQIWEDLESFDDETLLAESAAWHRKAGKSAKGGLNRKGVASYRAEHPGSKLQMAVTTKPSKLKHGSKAAKRRKSFCARMGGVKGPMKKPNGKPTRKALALRKWNC